MEWISCIREVIDYIEKNIESDISIDEIAKHVFVSSFFLQRGFSFIVGYGISEYIRNRRLYLAGLDLQNTNEKVVDIAFKYKYESHESFTKAFTRFHGNTPSKVRSGASVRVFLPLKISINISGGKDMDFKIVNMFPLKIIGFEKEFMYENAQTEIPKFWNEICDKYANNIYAGNTPSNPYEQAIVDNCIGEFGVCVDDLGSEKFRYIIGGKYTGGIIPNGMVVYEFPRGVWAIFDCIGPNPETLQSINARIFNEWLPNNPDYELCGNANIEWYDCINGEMTDFDYHSQVWIPVRKK